MKKRKSVKLFFLNNVNKVISIIFLSQLIFATSALAQVYPLKATTPGLLLEIIEPSGIALHKGKFFFVSDNNDDKAIYELVRGKKFYNARYSIRFNKNDYSRIDKKFKLDLEGIVVVNNYFFCVDEKDRFVYRINYKGRMNLITHDIDDYNQKHALKFSRKKNAGFEGIAFDLNKRIFFIANERENAIIYLLKFKRNLLQTLGHISMTRLSGNNHFDISDLLFEKNYLYALIRREKKILKLDPYNKRIIKTFCYSKITNGLYKPKKDFGFAEGLTMNEKSIFLLLDSGGKSMINQNFGNQGAFVVIKRPEGF